MFSFGGDNRGASKINCPRSTTWKTNIAQLWLVILVVDYFRPPLYRSIACSAAAVPSDFPWDICLCPTAEISGCRCWSSPPQSGQSTPHRLADLSKSVCETAHYARRDRLRPRARMSIGFIDCFRRRYHLSRDRFAASGIDQQA